MLAKQACHVYSFEHNSKQGFQGAHKDTSMKYQGVQSSAFSVATYSDGPLDACAMECRKGNVGCKPMDSDLLVSDKHQNL